MGFLFDIILLVLFVWLLPYILVGVVIGKILTTLADVFYLPALGAAFSVSGLAGMAWFNRIPDDTSPYASIIEVMAQSHVAGVQMPYVLAFLAAVLFVVALSKNFRKAA